VQLAWPYDRLSDGGAEFAGPENVGPQKKQW